MTTPAEREARRMVTRQREKTANERISCQRDAARRVLTRVGHYLNKNLSQREIFCNGVIEELFPWEPSTGTDVNPDGAAADRPPQEH